MEYVKIPLNGARRNPDKNPKLTIVEQLKPFYLEDKNPKDPKYFISFTDLPKLGINPSFKFNNPLGVYAYPLNRIWLYLIKNSIPFAGNRPYVQLLKRTTNKILDNSYTWNDFSEDIKKLKNYINKLNLKESIDFKKLQSETRAGVRNKESAIYNIWYFLLLLSKDLERLTSRKAPNIWTTLLVKALSYECVLDLEGEGFIHPSEPIQSVFLTKNSYQHIGMFLNKRYDNSRSIELKKQLFSYIQIGYPDNFPKNNKIEMYEYITSLHPTLKNVMAYDIVTVYDEDKTKICSGNIFSGVKNIYFVGKNGQPKSINWNEDPSPTTIVGRKIKSKVVSCDLSNVIATNCSVIKSTIRSGRFIDCDFSGCNWINGSYTYDVFFFENSKMSPQEIKKKYPEDKLTEYLFEKVLEMLGKKKNELKEKELESLYSLTKDRTIVKSVDLTELAKLTYSDEVYYNK